MTATPLYTPADLAWFRENYGETEFLVHVIGPDLKMAADDEGKPFTLYEADRLARRINEAPAAFTPRHATVFHYGRPLAAPEDIPAAPGFLAEELAFFKKEYGGTAWMVYVHGMDECYEQREEDDQPFTEEGARKLMANMAIWNREHVAEGLSASPTTLFHYGEPVTAVAK